MATTPKTNSMQAPTWSTANLPQFKDGMTLEEYNKQVQIALNIMQARINQLSAAINYNSAVTDINANANVKAYNAVWN